MRLWCNSLAISRIDLRFRKYSRRMISFWSTVIISSTPLAQDVALTSCNQKSGYGGPLFYCHFLTKWFPFVFPYTAISIPTRLGTPCATDPSLPSNAAKRPNVGEHILGGQREFSHLGHKLYERLSAALAPQPQRPLRSKSAMPPPLTSALRCFPGPNFGPARWPLSCIPPSENKPGTTSGTARGRAGNDALGSGAAGSKMVTQTKSQDMGISILVGGWQKSLGLGVVDGAVSHKNESIREIHGPILPAEPRP